MYYVYFLQLPYSMPQICSESNAIRQGNPFYTSWNSMLAGLISLLNLNSPLRLDLSSTLRRVDELTSSRSDRKELFDKSCRRSRFIGAAGIGIFLSFQSDTVAFHEIDLLNIICFFVLIAYLPHCSDIFLLR